MEFNKIEGSNYSLMIKFGQLEHLEKLQQGYLHCKTLKDFAKLESGDVRSDPDEGVLNQTMIDHGTIQVRPSGSIYDDWKSLRFFDGVFTTYRSGNIFCLSRIVFDPFVNGEKITINPRFSDFGGYYLLILNQRVFFQRLKKAIDRETYNISGRIVHYVNLADYIGERSPFIKDIRDSWQSEYRIFFDTNSEELLTFHMGDISDISILGKLKKPHAFDFRKRLE